MTITDFEIVLNNLPLIVLKITYIITLYITQKLLLKNTKPHCIIIVYKASTYKSHTNDSRCPRTNCS